MGNIDLMKYKIKDGYYKAGKKCIFDPVRKKLIIETPEEIVRQKFLTFLHDTMKVPFGCIEVECPMSDFKKRAKGRADIIIYGIAKEEGKEVLYSLAIIECKAKDVLLTDAVFEQVMTYNELVGADYIIALNDEEIVIGVWDSSSSQYRELLEIPSYEDMLKKQNLIFNTNKATWVRPDFSEIRKDKTIQIFREYGWIGEDTDLSLCPFLVNLCGLIQDESKKLSPQNLGYGITLIEDGGIRSYSYGNAAGGSWGCYYRYFLLKDFEGNNQIVSITMAGMLKCENHPKFKNRKGGTCLVVAIDDYEKSHNSLQLYIDRYTKKLSNEDKYIIWHDGTITVGKQGACKRQEVMDFINDHAPKLISEDGKIYLGTFDNTKEITWEQDSTRDFIGKIIQYAFVRDKFREYKKGEF